MKNIYFSFIKKRKPFILLTSLLLFLLATILIWKYYFNIYEVECIADKNYIWADNQSQVIIKCVVINSFGLKIPFRNIYAVFRIIEGQNLVDIIEADESNGILILKARFEEGKVVVKINSKYSLLPNLVDINIVKNLS